MNDDKFDQIKEILKSIELDVDEIASDTDLVLIGLDSLKVIELIVGLETYYNIIISDDDLYFDNFSCINRIAELLDKITCHK